MPTAYFAEGGPYMAVFTVSAILLKSLGMENRYVALWTELMMLPWSIKPLWAPFVDLFRTKRQWILATQLAMALLFAGIATLIGLFFLLAFASACAALRYSSSGISVMASSSGVTFRLSANHGNRKQIA